MLTILDCYTDEAAGLGVPPYIGTYPRYIYGMLVSEGHDVNYITIDDLRKSAKKSLKTDIKTYNRTRQDVDKILDATEQLVVICGVHVPGKYLSAVPGTLFEVNKLIKDLKCHKVLAGPASTVFGTRLEGGKKAETDTAGFDSKLEINNYQDIARYSVTGAVLVKKIPYEVIAEIETARGCIRSQGCSFCTEPLKHGFEKRAIKDIVAEVKALSKNGVVHFRLGKQSDFFSRSAKEIEELLSKIHAIKGIETLHIDNVGPARVTADKVKLVVKYCTPGNIAALGVESFDSAVVSANCLNSTPSTSMKAIRLINKYGSAVGSNGMQKFLPGVNILFGLKGETRKTHVENMKYFGQVLDEGLLVRRINVRQVALFPGTALYDYGMKSIRKNKKYYWKWRNEIRQKVDNPMLKKLVPVGTVLKDVRMEIYDGNTTFGRQFGTYPLIVGVKKRLELQKRYDVRVVGHMLRSVVGEVISN